MKINDNKTTRLSDDIRQIFINVYGEKPEMVRLCRDHNNPYLLNDRKPVLNITQDEFVGIFNVNSNHFPLPPDQSFRLGLYCNLPLPNLIAFILKSEWENYLSGMSGILNASGSNLAGQDLTDRYISGFNPNPGSIFNLFRDANDVSAKNITYSQVEFIVSDLLKKSVFLIANDQISRIYSKKEISEEVLLFNIPQTQKESYLKLKEIWLIKSTELDDLLMFLERKKRLNLGLENKYFRIFGNLEAEKSKLTYRLEKYSIILEVLYENPELSYRELIRSAEERLTKARREQNDIKNKITRSRNRIDYTITENSQETVSDDFRNSYMQECKKLLRKLFFLLHTDTCPNYSELTGHKKSEINKLWLKLMKSTKEEMYSFSPSMLLYSLPDYEQLKSIYGRSCAILGIDPDCYETGNRLEFMIRKGASIESITDFLKSETEKLELHLARLELVQNEYTNEDQTQIYRLALENINGYTEGLKCEISDIKKQLHKLKKQIVNNYLKVTR